MERIVILGSGMAGFGAAHRLHSEGIRPVMYDKNNYHGGHTASFRHDGGFLFDIGPHISYTKDPRIQELFADSVEQQYETLQIFLNNYWRGYWPQHPAQLHLHGLPEEVVIKVLTDFADVRYAPEQPIRNYADWLLSSFGRTFAELFPMQYTRKYHTTGAENLTTDWLGPRIYRPNMEEILRGALSSSAPQKHYITHCRYPSRGGFVAYLKKFLPQGNLNLNSEVTSVDPHERQLVFRDGRVAGYDRLISSVPLPDLVRMLKGVPAEVLEASQRLACSTCLLVNLAVDRPELSKAHLTYFYDEDICFSRIGFPHMLASSNTPPGTGTIQVEVYFSSKYKPFTGTPDAWIEPVVKDLTRCGVLHEGDKLLFRQAMLLPYANIIFDHDRKPALEIVHGYLNELGIGYCGRYGDWGYLWTDESFKSGEAAAEKVLSAGKSARPAVVVS
jgi:protoporphyrinogen oxidase